MTGQGCNRLDITAVSESYSVINANQTIAQVNETSTSTTDEAGTT